MAKLNIVDSLRSESESDCVAYTEFMLAYDKNNNSKLYLFFEGNEDRYYYPIRIENILNNSNIEDFVCNGKENVLKVHSLIKNAEAYKNLPTLFFIDSDFDENNYCSSIYVTPTYSLENFYVNEKSVEKIVIYEFKFAKETLDFVNIMGVYRNLINQFLNNVDKLNIWLACQADIRKEQDTLTRLKIDKSLNGYIKKSMICDKLTTYTKIEEISTIDKIERIFSDAPKVSKERYEKKEREFDSIDKLSKYRGKLMLRFLEAFLFKLQSFDFKKNNNVFEKKYSSSLRIEYNTMCSALSQYAETPQCLRDYLQNYEYATVKN